MQQAILENRLTSLVEEIDRQIAEIRDAASAQGTLPERMRYSDGTWVMTEILLAKATALNGLAVLKGPK